jgi:hypothetical protein
MDVVVEAQGSNAMKSPLDRAGPSRVTGTAFLSFVLALLAFAVASNLTAPGFRKALTVFLVMLGVGLFALAVLIYELRGAAKLNAWWTATGDRSAVAIEFADEHSLDFSLDSLRREVDRLLKLPIFRRGRGSAPANERERNEAALCAYIGETLRRHFHGTWRGRFSPTCPIRNFYESFVELNGFRYNPSIWIAYCLTNWSGEGTFAQELDKLLTEVERPDRACNEFALAMYAELRKQSGNIVFSPCSVRMTLAMAQTGAHGETAAEMGRVLRTARSDDQTNPGAGIQRLTVRGNGEYDLASANSLWCQQGVSLEAAFLDLIATRYGGEVREVDLQSGSNDTTAVINDWVRATTNGRISCLIPPGQLDRGTRLLLANAVYFKGRWALPFDRDQTRDEVFHLAGGSSVQVPMMHCEKHIRYARAARFQVAELDYEGSDLAMTIFLHDRRDGLETLEASLRPSVVDRCVTRMREQKVLLSMAGFLRDRAAWCIRGLGTPVEERFAHGEVPCVPEAWDRHHCVRESGRGKTRSRGDGANAE